MTQATHYTRTTGFADDERNNAGGRSTVGTEDVDFELDAIAAAVNLTIDNLTLLQRDDGVMRDGAVPVSALGADTLKLLSATGTPRGAWVTATLYAAKDLVTQGGNTYICVVGHTSGTFATDLGAVKWILFQIGANPSALAIPFSATANITSSTVQAAIAEVDTNSRTRDANLADTADPLKGAGLLGFNYSLGYAVGTVGKWLKDLATSAGAPLIGFLQAGTGAVLRSLQSELSDSVKPQRFGVKFDGATDDTAAWAVAMAYATSVGGCTFECPRGTSILSGQINLPVRTLIVGKGKLATQLSFSHAGDGIKSTSPINSSTAVRSGIRDVGLINTSGANTGGGFVDVGGTYQDVIACFFQGWKYQVILDQTEIAHIERCELLQASGQVGIWLVNGPDHTISASTGFTNRITIKGSQFNGGAGAAENILDDGGVNHTITDNNFNAGTIGIRAAGVLGLKIQNNESESHTTNAVYFAATTKAGAYVGPCSGVAVNAGNTFSDIVANQVLIDDLTHASITDNAFGQATFAAVVFSAGTPATAVLVDRNAKLVLGSARTAAPFVSVPTTQVARNNKILQAAHTYSAGSIASGSVAVTPASMEAIKIGTRLVAVNADGTSGESVQVTNVTGATFSATFANAHTANFIIRGVTTQDEEEGTWTPSLVGSTTPGAHIYSVQAGSYVRRGNLVHAKFNITVTTKDAGMAGAGQITGLPFTAENVSNQSGTCAIAGFTGLTFPASFAQLGGTISAGASIIVLLRSGSGVAFSNPQASEFGAAFTLFGEVIFYTSSV